MAVAAGPAIGPRAASLDRLCANRPYLVVWLLERTGRRLAERANGDDRRAGTVVLGSDGNPSRRSVDVANIARWPVDAGEGTMKRAI
jgi:hypothetical protein